MAILYCRLHVYSLFPVMRITGLHGLPHAGTLLVLCLVFLGYGSVCESMAASATSGDSCDRAWMLINQGLALSDNSDEEALCYKEAFTLCPGLPDAGVRLGRIYRNQGNLDEAATVFQDSITSMLADDFFMARSGSKDTLLNAMLSLGEVYRMQGRLDLAEKQYSRALLMFPDSVAAQNQVQYIYRRLHRYDSSCPPRFAVLTNPPFTRISGFSLPRNKVLIDTMYRYWVQDGPLSADMFNDDRLLFPPLEREVNIHLWTAGIRYGVTDRFTVGVIAKYFSKKLHIRARRIITPGGPIDADDINARVSGIGDTIIMLKYQLWGRRQSHLSVYNLLSLPTGDDDSKEHDGTSVWKIPLGSGSFDNTPGIAFSTRFDPVITNLNLSYRITDGENAGDELNLGMAFSYPYKSSVYASLEFAYRWRDDVRIKQAGNYWIKEYGGSTFFIEPGIQFMVAKGLKLEVGVKVPLIKPDKGWAEDYVLSAGMAKIFF